VGRFIEQKNHAGLIQIHERIVKQRPDSKLLLVGEGPLRRSVENLASRMGLEESILFLGFRNDVPELMTKCDVFLLPSLHEGLPVVCLEGQAAGLPVVGSRIPGLVEAVEEDRTAFLHDVWDCAGMAESVLKLLDDRQLATAMQKAGRARIRSFFSREAAAKRLMGTYTACLSTSDGQS